VDIWVFACDRWLASNAKGAYVDLEARTIAAQPTIVERFDDHVDAIAKIVGVSAEFDRLAACAPIAHRMLAGRASIARSQPYYLDITPAGVDKGVFVTDLAGRLGIPAEEIVTIGDMENDIPMFRKSGFSIAMGNASPEVKRLAHATTLSNDDDGFAAAVDELILPRVRPVSGSV
jgi:HAD superfamily hydrolase (TIGR01484 family)